MVKTAVPSKPSPAGDKSAMSRSQVKTAKPQDGPKSIMQPKTLNNTIDENSRKSVKEKQLSPQVYDAMVSFVEKTVSLGIDGLKREFDRVGPPKMLASAAFKANPTKNRYTNIACFDFNRVCFL